MDEDWYTQARPHKKRAAGPDFHEKRLRRILARQSIVRMGNEYTAIDTPLFGSVFAGNQEVRCIVLSNRLYRLHSGQFERCRKLREVDLPVYLEELPERVLMDCSSLQKLSVPGGVKRIGASAAAGCNRAEASAPAAGIGGTGRGCVQRLRSAGRTSPAASSAADGRELLPWVQGAGRGCDPRQPARSAGRAFGTVRSLGKVVLHAGVERIGAEAFAGTDGWVTTEGDEQLHVWIPETVTDIAPGAFERPAALCCMGPAAVQPRPTQKKNQLPFRPE